MYFNNIKKQKNYTKDIKFDYLSLEILLLAVADSFVEPQYFELLLHLPNYLKKN